MAAKTGKRAAVIGGGIIALALLVGAGYEATDEEIDDEDPGDRKFDLRQRRRRRSRRLRRRRRRTGVTDEPTRVTDEPTRFTPEEPTRVTPTPEVWDPTVYEHPTNYPTHGVHHQVVPGDIFGGKGGKHNMAWAALYEAAFEGAIEYGGVSEADAHVYAASVAKKAANRGKYINLILCAPSNDLTYGTYGFGTKAPVGEHGRSIRLLKIHPDNRDRIFSQEPPIRNIEMGEPGDQRTGTGGSVDSDYREEFEYLWFPRLNTKRLWETGQITTEGESWDDGSSTMLPPPEIWALGINVLEDLPISTFGCMGAEEEMA